jgi:glycosyltransferase involved in cell wall biosynthesis
VATERIVSAPDGPAPLFVALGRDQSFARKARADVRLVPYQTAPGRMASYYQAADLYVHAARADTFPSAVLESLACGTPVVATDVGGIGEQIRVGGDDVTGVLVPRGDAVRLAAAATGLLADDARRARLGANAAADARARFDRERQVDAYLAWYREVADEWKARQ